MNQQRIKQYLAKREVPLDHRVDRDGGGQYITKFLLEFKEYVRKETIKEIREELKHKMLYL